MPARAWLGDLRFFASSLPWAGFTLLLRHGRLSALRATAVVAYSRAVLFLAIVPAVSVIVGIPIVGENPGALQVAGLCLVTLGLLVTIGVVGRLRLRFRVRFDRAARRSAPGISDR